MLKNSIILSSIMVLPLIACGGDDGDNGNNPTIDAAVVAIDAMVEDPDAATADACGTYCAAAMTNCTGANQLYVDMPACMASCAAIPVGTPADQSGNTVYCRAYHTTNSPPETHCPHASAGSDGGICGTTCDAYCDQVMTNCVGANEQYVDRAACLAGCGRIANIGLFNDQGGQDTVQCRVYHGSFPAAAAPGTHCGHAGEVSAMNVCTNAG